MEIPLTMDGARILKFSLGPSMTWSKSTHPTQPQTKQPIYRGTYYVDPGPIVPDILMNLEAAFDAWKKEKGELGAGHVGDGRIPGSIKKFAPICQV